MRVDDVRELDNSGLGRRANRGELVTAGVEERRQHGDEVRLGVAPAGLGDGAEEVRGSLLGRLVRLGVEASAELLQDAISLQGADARLIAKFRRRIVRHGQMVDSHASAVRSHRAQRRSCRFPPSMTLTVFTASATACALSAEGAAQRAARAAAAISAGVSAERMNKQGSSAELSPAVLPPAAPQGVPGNPKQPAKVPPGVRRELEPAPRLPAEAIPLSARCAGPQCLPGAGALSPGHCRRTNGQRCLLSLCSADDSLVAHQ